MNLRAFRVNNGEEEGPNGMKEGKKHQGTRAGIHTCWNSKGPVKLKVSRHLDPTLHVDKKQFHVSSSLLLKASFSFSLILSFCEPLQNLQVKKMADMLQDVVKLGFRGKRKYSRAIELQLAAKKMAYSK